MSKKDLELELMKMNPDNIRNFAQHSIEAGQILFNSADDLININQIAEMNQNLPNILERVNSLLVRANQLIDGLDNFKEKNQLNFNRLQNKLNHRLKELAIVAARAINANCVRLTSPINWIRIDERPFPHYVPTLEDLNNLDPRFLIELLEFYNLPVQRNLVDNRRILGAYHGIPSFLQ
ncbi:unnamed protein product [Brachionus calyciflorus]|uniref:Uncharacterized protein n=1 Tax=Brachionus calyciflorus TaxID=104777 RepID=A0A814FZT5_9BILA|nr:unnamed protein product [Brachionus calyciflorus]